MHGIELSQKYFEHSGLPFLQREAPELLPEIAAGLAGHGSECFGYDDQYSRDHDFSAGFSLWISEKDEPEIGWKLTRLWERFRKETPPPALSAESFGAAPEQGVTTIESFFNRHLGVPGVPTHWKQWLYIPEYAFAEALNGKIFYDGPGRFSAMRKELAASMPEDVRLKKIAARAAMMAQCGQYNFARALKHGEKGAAALALNEFVRNGISLIFLLNRRFAPYYKWQFRALRELPCLSELAEPLEFLLAEAAPEELKEEIIESIASGIENEMLQQGLSQTRELYLEAHAIEVMRKIQNQEIRALHIMEG